MSNIWDDPDLRSNDDFVRWETPGDTIVGEIVHLSKHTFDDGKSVPKLVIRQDDGVERTLTAGQVQLAARLAELRPGVGDRVAIVFTKVEPRGGGKTLKHFDVEVKTGSGASSSVPVPAASSSESKPASSLI